MSRLSYIQGVSATPLGLEGYGFLRASAIRYVSSDVGAALATAVTDIGCLPQTFTRQLCDQNEITRCQGVRGLVRLFAETPDVRAQILGALRSDPLLVRTYNAWKNPLWVNTVDFIMGVGESFNITHADFVEKMTLNLPLWTIDFGNSGTHRGIGRFLIDSFAPLVTHTITREIVEDEEMWRSALPMLHLYWAIARSYFNNVHSKKESSLSTQILKITELLRAYRMLGCGIGGESGETRECGEKVRELLYAADGSPRLGTSGRTYTELWERIYECTPPSDPLVPLPEKRGAFISAKLEEWITNALSKEDMPESFCMDVRLRDLLREGRATAINRGRMDEFIKILITSGVNTTERVECLNNFLTNHENSSRRLSLSPSIKQRLVTWNPYEVDEGAVIHPHLGEGRLAGIPEGDGMVEVYFLAQQSLCKVSSAALTFAHDRNAFVAAHRDRAWRYYDKAPYFGAIVTYHALAARDSAKIAIEAYDANAARNLSSAATGILTGDKIFARRQMVPKVSSLLCAVGVMLGFDPIAWVWRMTSGQPPHALFSDRMSEKKRRFLIRHVTSDLIRSFVWFRPWNHMWRDASPSKGRLPTPDLQTAGYYYPGYYRGGRDNDLTKLYFRYRAGDGNAIARAAHLMQPLIDAWARDPARRGDVLVIPMIGTAPNTELAQRFGYSSLFPWQPRPQNYGEGVEGRVLFQKMEMVSQALKIDPAYLEQIKGRSVLIVDDNVTDFATWMVARKLMYEAEAAEVGLVALTETLRRSEDREWLLR